MVSTNLVSKSRTAFDQNVEWQCLKNKPMFILNGKLFLKTQNESHLSVIKNSVIIEFPKVPIRTKFAEVQGT